MKRTIFLSTALSIVFIITVLSVGCGSGITTTPDNPIQGKVIASGPIGNLKVTLSNETGKLKSGDQEVMLAFTDAAGKAVDAGSVTAAALSVKMPAMGSMNPMTSNATFTTTPVPGVYKGKIKIDMAGEWQAQISYEGSAGNGKTVIPVTVQ